PTPRPWSSWQMDLGGGRFRQKPVAHTAYRQQMPGLRRVLLDILAQAHHKIVDGSRVGVLPQIPDLLQNGLARYNLSAIPNEMAQQFRLHQCQAKDFAIGP